MEFRFDEDELAVLDAVLVVCADRYDLGDVGREGEPAAPLGALPSIPARSSGEAASRSDPSRPPSISWPS